MHKKERNRELSRPYASSSKRTFGTASALAIMVLCALPGCLPVDVPTPDPVDPTGRFRFSNARAFSIDDALLPDTAADMIFAALDDNPAPDAIVARFPIIADLETQIPYVTVLYNVGTSGVAAIETIETPNWIAGMQVMPNDGDDGVSVIHAATSGFYSLSGFSASEVPTRTTLIEFDSDAYIPSFAVGDVNQDGLWDIVASEVGTLWVWVLLQTTDGLLVQDTAYDISAEGLGSNPRDFPGRIILADVDMDWDLDVVVANRTAALGCSILLNDGVGGFASPTQYGPYVEELAVGDAEGDGDLDIAIVGFSGFSWLVNDGSGRFRRLNCGLPHPRSDALLLGHFNRNDFLDAVVLDDETGSLQLVELDQDGTCAVRAEIDAGLSPLNFELIAADVDVDGATDIVVLQHYASVSIFRNLIAEAAD